MATDLEIAAAIKGLADCYPQFELKKATIAAYAKLLHDIPADVLRAAAAHCATTSKWFPTVAELRDAAFGIIENRAGIPSAAEAWGEVMAAMRYAAPARRPQFSHPVIRRAVEAVGGWYTLCTSESGVADRSKFFQAYEQIVARDREQARMLPEVCALSARLRAAPERARLSDGRR